MSLLLDAAPLIALLDSEDVRQTQRDQILAGETGPLVLPAPVTAEVDYMVRKKSGRAARRAFFRDLAEGRFLVACLEPGDYDAIRRYDEQYADLDVGLADLSIVVLAQRFRTRRVLTCDQRHFRTLKPLDGGSFQLLPFDQD